MWQTLSFTSFIHYININFVYIRVNGLQFIITGLYLKYRNYPLLSHSHLCGSKDAGLAYNLSFISGCSITLTLDPFIHEQITMLL